MLFEETRHYRIGVRFTWTKWIGRSSWLMYLGGMGFYHVKMSLSTGAADDLKMFLAEEIEGMRSNNVKS